MEGWWGGVRVRVRVLIGTVARKKMAIYTKVVILKDHRRGVTARRGGNLHLFGALLVSVLDRNQHVQKGNKIWE